MQSTEIIIVAAGSGHRFGSPLPKQFCLLNDKPVVMHTIAAFRRYLPESRITLVLSADMSDYWQKLCEEYCFDSPNVVHGGDTRWESIRNAIRAIDKSQISDDDLIIVHDGVRPIVGAEMLKRLTETLHSNTEADGVIPSVPVTDSIRQVDINGSSVALDRATLRAIQTPQVFRATRLCKAYELPYKCTYTDDASVMEAAGFDHLLLADGDIDNIKITNPGDITIASLIISRRSDL